MGASFAGSAGFVVRFDGQEGLEACVEKLLARAETRPLATAFVLNVLVVAPRDEGVPEAVRLVLAKKRRNDLGGDADDDGDESDGEAYAALFNSNTQPAAPSPVPRLNLGGDDAADGAYAVDWHRDATLGLAAGATASPPLAARVAVLYVNAPEATGGELCLREPARPLWRRDAARPRPVDRKIRPRANRLVVFRGDAEHAVAAFAPAASGGAFGGARVSVVLEQYAVPPGLRPFTIDFEIVDGADYARQLLLVGAATAAASDLVTEHALALHDKALNATGILDLVALDVNFIEDWSSGACPADASHGGLNGCVADRFFLCAEKTLPAADAWPFIHCGYQYQKCLMLSR
ncbi:hypothetical protein AURANDRAFT_68721 [Aureococcus anophagefferens]|uniref:Prolyl 4-hydroxylase alpha subunit Fe(2+) 2OG dioxygenase domain-containing protein n=1 Tax=Aureococcus anophagefferens TaxID=44056 RepID=F0YQJ7_AURAN|nr:hypothetical protein AURANDRAFT_68721 [Aureococcus anophagefferens]EGB02612.1 hypothetical protein AURANDRAFT_68721 [Aureococcus anophagefferens]|eukprot:XP_009042688.1 hypothetical protein AURANDRAFT_68721 [Aureococcus anophagefferens]